MAAANKLPFKTAYGDRERHYIPTGNGMEDIYGYEINKYGQKVLVKQGEFSLYDKIQESLEETKIENILERYAAGDNTVMRPDGIYADLTNMPTNLLEARQSMQKLENLWNGLDPKVKKEYDYDLDKFIANSGSEKWLEDMGLLKKESKEIIETNKKEVTNNDEGN